MLLTIGYSIKYSNKIFGFIILYKIFGFNAFGAP